MPETVGACPELRRRWSPRLGSLLMISLGVAFAAADLLLQRPVVATFTGLAALALLALPAVVRRTAEDFRNAVALAKTERPAGRQGLH